MSGMTASPNNNQIAAGTHPEPEWLRIASGAPPPRVSLIMAAWQTERTIGEAVHSILEQPGVAFELIVLDDASTDQTLDAVLALKDDRLTVGRLPERLPAAAVRNHAIRRARAPWICIFDADDLMEKETLADYLAWASTTPNCRWAYTGLRLVGEHGADTGNQMRTPFDLLKILQRNIVTHPMSLYTRELFGQAGGYNESLRHQEDYDVWLRFLPHAIPSFYDRLCVRYRRHPASIGARETGATPLPAPQTVRTLLNEADINAPHLTAAIDLLDASEKKQWPQALTAAEKLDRLGVAGFERDRQTVEALTGCERKDEAFPLVFAWIQRIAAGEKILPYEQVWALTHALDMLLALDMPGEAQKLLPLANLVAEQQHDAELDRLIAAVRAKNEKMSHK